MNKDSVYLLVSVVIWVNRNIKVLLKITDAIKAVARVGLSCIGYGNDPRYQPDVREPVNNVGATNFIELIDGSVWPGN